MHYHGYSCEHKDYFLGCKSTPTYTCIWIQSFHASAMISYFLKLSTKQMTPHEIEDMQLYVPKHELWLHAWHLHHNYHWTGSGRPDNILDKLGYECLKLLQLQEQHVHAWAGKMNYHIVPSYPKVIYKFTVSTILNIWRHEFSQRGICKGWTVNSSSYFTNAAKESYIYREPLIPPAGVSCYIWCH